jgi:hypothetical protein
MESRPHAITNSPSACAKTGPSHVEVWSEADVVAVSGRQLDYDESDSDLEPEDLVGISVDIATSIAIESVGVADLPADWRTYPAPLALATIGERWLRESRSSVLSVPSVIIPTELNFILNPAHGDFRKVGINPPEPFSFDPRMWTTRHRS